MAPVKRVKRRSKVRIAPWFPRRFNPEGSSPVAVLSRSVPQEAPPPPSVQPDVEALAERFSRVFGSPDVREVIPQEWRWGSPASLPMTPTASTPQAATPSPLWDTPILSSPDPELVAVCNRALDCETTANRLASLDLGITPLPGMSTVPTPSPLLQQPAVSIRKKKRRSRSQTQRKKANQRRVLVGVSLGGGPGSFLRLPRKEAVEMGLILKGEHHHIFNFLSPSKSSTRREGEM
ncbi:uncharacterized protein LOC116160446 [Photinus pyralis]|nr:uncharacterized protein LOC116160446 [Photinus pyralis]